MLDLSNDMTTSKIIERCGRPDVSLSNDIFRNIAIVIGLLAERFAGTYLILEKIKQYLHAMRHKLLDTSQGKNLVVHEWGNCYQNLTIAYICHCISSMWNSRWLYIFIGAMSTMIFTDGVQNFLLSNLVRSLKVYLLLILNCGS